MSKRFLPRKKEDMGNQVCIEATEDEKPSLVQSSGTKTDTEIGVLVPTKSIDDDSLSKQSSKRSLRSGKKNPVRFAQFVSHAVTKIGTVVESIMFVEEAAPVIPKRTVRGGVLLHGCDTPEEHFERLDYVLGIIKELDLTGEEGLRAAGLELRYIRCDQHATKEPMLLQEGKEGAEDAPEHDESSVSDMSQVGESSVDAQEASPEHCDDCVTRLVHKQTDTLVDHSNRKTFVSDGPMYDEISRFCMEYAHEKMIEEGDLKWVQISDDDDRGGKTINALVSSTHLAAGGTEGSRPTLLVVTGKGKVRAGIFSRQHIQTTGLEPSTALFVIREAKKRNMNVIMLDPNIRGEREAYVVVQKSMAKLFEHIENPSSDDETRYPLFVQAHSAAGSHVVRYLMDHCDAYLPHIRAMAFTDSTHNVQWTKKMPALYDLLESPATVYFRSSRGADSQACKSHHAGLEMKTDSNWQHRFGKVRTCWAGTTEHSLSDWSARKFIWEHFDQHLQ